MKHYDLQRQIASLEERAKSNTHRIDEVMKRQDTFDKLVSSVEILAIRQEGVESTVKEIKTDVKALTEKPGKRWDSFVWEVIKILVAAVLGFVIARLGL